MKVLIVAASRHGATTEIAEAIATRLKAGGMDATVSDPAHASLEECDAFIVGSAVYAGSWLKEGRDFVNRHAVALAQRPMWLFSSGPLADPDAEAIPADQVDALREATHALGHHIFAGRIDHHRLGPAERLMAKLVKAPDGDFRDWEDIASWADDIVDELSEPTST